MALRENQKLLKITNIINYILIKAYLYTTFPPKVSHWMLLSLPSLIAEVKPKV